MAEAHAIEHADGPEPNEHRDIQNLPDCQRQHRDHTDDAWWPVQRLYAPMPADPHGEDGELQQLERNKQPTQHANRVRRTSPVACRPKGLGPAPDQGVSDTFNGKQGHRRQQQPVRRGHLQPDDTRSTSTARDSRATFLRPCHTPDRPIFPACRGVDARPLRAPAITVADTPSVSGGSREA